METGEIVTIESAVSPADLEVVRELWREYARIPGYTVCFQGFAAELAALPGPYAEPGGALLLARIESHAAGAVGLVPDTRTPRTMILKRLFVRPAWRRRGIGRRLAEAALAVARGQNVRTVFLDTLPAMTEAQALYRELGFRPCPRAGSEIAPLHYALNL